MRLLAFLSLTGVAVTIAIVQDDYSWLLAPVSVFLFLGLSPLGVSKTPKTVRRPVTGAAAAGTAGGGGPGRGRPRGRGGAGGPRPPGARAAAPRAR
ncbi:hypothetical protein, partial [Streptomyces niveus]|uniref:hypothetical protein n=1 Tax=Streptomyces niveus TaxID=193462 RepID=UPI0035D85697